MVLELNKRVSKQALGDCATFEMSHDMSFVIERTFALREESQTQLVPDFWSVLVSRTASFSRKIGKIDHVREFSIYGIVWRLPNLSFRSTRGSLPIVTMKGMPTLLAALGGNCRHRISAWTCLSPSRNFVTFRGATQNYARPSLTSTFARTSPSGPPSISFKIINNLMSRSYSVKDGVPSLAGRRIQPRFFSANTTFQTAVGHSAELPVLSPPSVGRWLLICSMLAFGVIVVGGVTRLTESGLSITEWKPVTGILPPISQAEWEEEFTKYKATPEFKM